MQEGASDALVGADALDHVVHVGADRFAQRGHGVDERDLHRQEPVGGVLDRLRRSRVGEQDLGVEVAIERRHTLGGGRVVAPDHDAIGMEEVVDGRPLAEELGIGHDGHVGRRSTRSTTRVEPTGTVDLLTTTAPGRRTGPI